MKYCKLYISLNKYIVVVVVVVEDVISVRSSDQKSLRINIVKRTLISGSEMESVTEISKSQPHAAYVAFTKGFKAKLLLAHHLIV